MFRLGRHSRYIRWRRSTEEIEDSASSSETDIPVGGAVDSYRIIDEKSESYAKVKALKDKLAVLLTKFTHLSELFVDNNELTSEYLSNTDDLMFL